MKWFIIQNTYSKIFSSSCATLASIMIVPSLLKKHGKCSQVTFIFTPPLISEKLTDWSTLVPLHIISTSYIKQIWNNILMIVTSSSKNVTTKCDVYITTVISCLLLVFFFLCTKSSNFTIKLVQLNVSATL